MLGFIGFTVATIIFGLFAYSSANASDHIKSPFKGLQFSLAYVAVALAMASWGIGTMLSYEYLKYAIAMGNVFLVIATLLLLWVITKKHKVAYTVGVGLLALAAAIYRLFIAGVDSVMRDNVLVFNTPKEFGVLLIVAFIAIWLPANKQFYTKLLEKSVAAKPLGTVYYSSNILALISVGGFIFAKKSLTIVVAFSMLVLAYLTLLILNHVVLQIKAEEHKNAKR